MPRQLKPKHKVLKELEKLGKLLPPSHPWALELGNHDFILMIEDKDEQEKPMGCLTGKFVRNGKLLRLRAMILDKRYRNNRFTYETDAILSFIPYAFEKFPDIYGITTQLTYGIDSETTTSLLSNGFEKISEKRPLKKTPKVILLGISRENYEKNIGDWPLRKP